MEQKIPTIEASDIERIIRREFPKIHVDDVISVLNGYKSESHKGRNRVHAVVLKLAKGNLTLLQEFIDRANYDFRDVISLAEYPSYSEKGFGVKMSNEDELALIKNDWTQYDTWLNMK